MDSKLFNESVNRLHDKKSKKRVIKENQQYHVWAWESEDQQINLVGKTEDDLVSVLGLLFGETVDTYNYGGKLPQDIKQWEQELGGPLKQLGDRFYENHGRVESATFHNVFAWGPGAREKVTNYVNSYGYEGDGSEGNAEVRI